MTTNFVRSPQRKHPCPREFLETPVTAMPKDFLDWMTLFPGQPLRCKAPFSLLDVHDQHRPRLRPLVCLLTEALRPPSQEQAISKWTITKWTPFCLHWASNNDFLVYSPIPGTTWWIFARRVQELFFLKKKQGLPKRLCHGPFETQAHDRPEKITSSGSFICTGQIHSGSRRLWSGWHLRYLSTLDFSSVSTFLSLL